MNDYNYDTWIDGDEEKINYTLSRKYDNVDDALEEVPNDIFDRFGNWELVKGNVLYGKRKIEKKVKHSKCSVKYRGIF